MLALAVAVPTIASLNEEGPACPVCKSGTLVIGKGELTTGPYRYFRCRVCQHVGDTRPDLRTR